MYLIFRLLVLAGLAYLAYGLWRRWQLQALERRKPPQGFSEVQDPLVRCERCGIQIPSSQVAAMRANCRQCGPDAA